MYRGGVRAFEKKLADADGVEHAFFYKARTPNEIAAHVGAEAAFPNDEAGAVSRQKYRAKFLSASLCDEAGEPLVTPKEAENITTTFKSELILEILRGSSEAGDAGKA